MAESVRVFAVFPQALWQPLWLPWRWRLALLCAARRKWLRTRRAWRPTGTPIAHIAEAIRQVSADHIRQTIEKLVSFQNRSTISAQDEESIKAGKGIGAAREWIKAEFERYSKDCGGCLEVKTDTFHRAARRPHSETDRNHQCLCGAARSRSAAGESHRARDRPLRLAQQRYF